MFGETVLWGPLSDVSAGVSTLTFRIVKYSGEALHHAVSPVIWLKHVLGKAPRRWSAFPLIKHHLHFPHAQSSQSVGDGALVPPTESYSQPPPFCALLWGKKSQDMATLEKCEVRVTSLWVELLCKWFGILCVNRFIYFTPCLIQGFLYKHEFVALFYTLGCSFVSGSFTSLRQINNLKGRCVLTPGFKVLGHCRQMKSWPIA